MSFPRYPEYKDSGVEWLGEVPGHWEINQLKHAYSVVGGSTPSSGIPELWDGDIVWVTPSDLSKLKSFEIGSSLRTITDAGLASCGTNLLPVGSIVLSTRAPIGSLGIAGVELCTNQGCKGLVPKSDQCSLFGAYLLAVMGGELNIQGRGTTFLELSGEALGAVKIPLPPESEQACIAAFLDRETAKIDALVAEQQNLIALLKEKRQALISQGVTKGLDPDVPMKDSGVAWLGEVPAHWTLTKLKYSTSHIIDCPHETPTYCPDGDYLVVRTADVDAGALDLSNAYRLDEVEYLKRTRRAKLVPQDIVYGREGERWGYAATVPDEPVLCLGQRMMQFRARAGIAPRFLMWQLNSDVTYRQGQVDTVGATSPHVNVSTIANYVLTEPPFSEQVEIANYVDGATSEIDDLVSEARATVELLQERRTALISAAVTGKIDVRHLAVATADPTPEPA